MTLPKKNSIVKFVEGDWELPALQLKNWGGYRYYPLTNKIGINTFENEKMEHIIAGFVHEINHWAQMYLLDHDTRDKILDAHDLWFGEYDTHLLEKAAWWGTGFVKKYKKDSEW